MSRDRHIARRANGNGPRITSGPNDFRVDIGETDVKARDAVEDGNVRLHAAGPVSGWPSGTLMMRALTGSMTLRLALSVTGMRRAASQGSGLTSTARTELEPKRHPHGARFARIRHGVGVSRRRRTLVHQSAGGGGRALGVVDHIRQSGGPHGDVDLVIARFDYARGGGACQSIDQTSSRNNALLTVSAETGVGGQRKRQRRKRRNALTRAETRTNRSG